MIHTCRTHANDSHLVELLWWFVGVFSSLEMPPADKVAMRNIQSKTTITHDFYLPAAHTRTNVFHCYQHICLPEMVKCFSDTLKWERNKLLIDPNLDDNINVFTYLSVPPTVSHIFLSNSDHICLISRVDLNTLLVLLFMLANIR